MQGSHIYNSRNLMSHLDLDDFNLLNADQSTIVEI